MKIRCGFVSNSSSSSFVVVLPKNFDPRLIDYKKYDEYGETYNIRKSKIVNEVQKLLDNGFIYSEDSFCFHVIVNCLKDIGFAKSFRTGPEDGFIMVVKPEEVINFLETGSKPKEASDEN